ncbi:hypothetical protein C5167_014216 [Papaver somniferum]|uniref:Uncharacterized protein n=1 Tax=Papaver somniferum TaxID=3469 RepID=A0A4Y7J3G0_PAPSO|nr:hypothetical protein C5167_014216 [Papaver somniferum]
MNFISCCTNTNSTIFSPHLRPQSPIHCHNTILTPSATPISATSTSTTPSPPAIPHHLKPHSNSVQSSLLSTVLLLPDFDSAAILKLLATVTHQHLHPHITSQAHCAFTTGYNPL